MGAGAGQRHRSDTRRSRRADRTSQAAHCRRSAARAERTRSARRKLGYGYCRLGAGTESCLMRRFLIQGALCAGLLFVATPLHSQETKAEEQEKALLDRVGRWKIINTAIFIALLGWYIAKK